MTTTTNLTTTDRQALQRAITLTLAEPDASRIEQVQSMLRERDWLQVAEFCSYHRQCMDLELKPWEWTPCWLGEDLEQLEDIIARGPQHNQHFVAATVLKQMLAAGLSKYDPTPRDSVGAPSGGRRSQ